MEDLHLIDMTEFQGFVTTYKEEDLSVLQELLSLPPESILKAGLHPTAEQIELYAYHLPHSTLSNLIVSIALHPAPFLIIFILILLKSYINFF